MKPDWNSQMVAWKANRMTIMAMEKAGQTRAQIAKKMKITTQRVGQIVKKESA